MVVTTAEVIAVLMVEVVNALELVTIVSILIPLNNKIVGEQIVNRRHYFSLVMQEVITSSKHPFILPFNHTTPHLTKN